MAMFCFSGLYRLDRLHFIVCFNVARFCVLHDAIVALRDGTGSWRQKQRGIYFSRLRQQHPWSSLSLCLLAEALQIVRLQF